MRSVPESKTLSISSARELLKQRKDEFKLPSNFNSEEFRMVANGFFQAEGHISCRIRGKYFSPVFVVNQKLTAKSLEFFFCFFFNSMACSKSNRFFNFN